MEYSGQDRRPCIRVWESGPKIDPATGVNEDDFCTDLKMSPATASISELAHWFACCPALLPAFVCLLSLSFF